MKGIVFVGLAVLATVAAAATVTSKFVSGAIEVNTASTAH